MSPLRRRESVLVSAHRCLTRPDLERALGIDVDFVEFDVQRCGDGAMVLFHDDHVRVGDADVPLASLTLDDLRAVHPDLVAYDEVLTALVGDHIDAEALRDRGRLVHH